MKKALTYSAIVLLLASVACNKTDSTVLTGSDDIRFAPASSRTRALIEDEAALRAQTFKVYDYMGTTAYIDNTIVYDETEAAWVYGDDATYKWADGTHKFFGYTDGAGTFASNALSVSKTLTTAEANQVDLLYSDVFTTTAANWKATKTTRDPVVLDLHHLLAAVSFMVTNTTSNQVVLNSVDVKIPNKGSATVNYAGDAPAVTYGAVTTDGNFISAAALSDLTLTQDQVVDVLTQAAMSDPTDTLYQVVWPQEFANDGDLVVNVKYTMTIPATDTEPAISSTFDANVKIPAIEWEAGHKYAYMLKITPSDIQLIFKVMEWDEGEAGSIDTSTGSINMSNVTWMNSKVTVGGAEVNTVVNGDYAVYMYYHPTVNGETYTANNGYFPAQGYFTVNYPTSGLYKIGLIPAYGETEVDEDAYEIVIWNGSTFVAINPDGEAISKETVYFQVRAAANQDGAEHLAQIDIWFKPDGGDEWISAYSEIRANYALTIPAR